MNPHMIKVLYKGEHIMREASNEVEFLGDVHLGNLDTKRPPTIPRRLPVLHPGEELIEHMDGTLEIIDSGKVGIEELPGELRFAVIPGFLFIKPDGSLPVSATALIKHYHLREGEYDIIEANDVGRNLSKHIMLRPLPSCDYPKTRGETIAFAVSSYLKRRLGITKAGQNEISL